MPRWRRAGAGMCSALDPVMVDAVRFERLAGAGQAALSGGEAAVAADRFRQALGLWRGRALADVCVVEPLAREAARLEELRLAAVEGRIEADIALGLHAEVTGELEGLVAEYPLRERLWRLLVLALYRAERQADALAAYRRARDMLAEELGLEPGEELRRLEQAVLRQEVPAAPAPARHNLPAPLTSFLGREQDLAKLDRLLGQARLVTLDRDRRDGEDPAGAGDRGAGGGPVPGRGVAGRAGRHRRSGAGGRAGDAGAGRAAAGDVPVLEALIYRLRSAELLLILDNCEHLLDACAQLAGALLRAAPGLRVLATSREPLGLPGEVICPVRPLDLPPETAEAREAGQAAAVRLFLDRGSAARGGTADGVAPVAVAERICRKLDGLPLAIELAAARLGTLSAAEIEAHLADRFRFLAYRRPGADPRHQALRAAMDWSYDLLSAEERRVLGELSVFAGTFGLAQAAEVCGGGDQVNALGGDRPAGGQVAGGRRAGRGRDPVPAAGHGPPLRGGPARRGRRHRGRPAPARGRVPEPGRAGTQAGGAGARAGQLPRRAGMVPGARRPGRAAAGPRPRAASGSAAGYCRRGGTGWTARSPSARPISGCGRTCCGCSARCCSRPVTWRARTRCCRKVCRSRRRAHPRSRPGSGSCALTSGTTRARDTPTRWLNARRRQLSWNPRTTWTDWPRRSPWPAGCCSGSVTFQPVSQFSSAPSAARGTAAITATQMRASHWLAVTFSLLSIPADTGVTRTEQLLADASGDPWAEADLLKPLCVLYAHVGRSADARAAIDRSQSIFAGFGAKLALAESAVPAAIVGLIIGDPAAAERYARRGIEEFQAMGEHRLVHDLIGLLADALYEQGRFDEAQQLLDEAGTRPWNTVYSTWLTEAKLLARRGQFTAARTLVGQAEARLSPTSSPMLRANALKARAEVERLAGAPGQAAASLRAALDIYEQQRATALAGQARTALASLAAQPGRDPA